MFLLLAISLSIPALPSSVRADPPRDAPRAHHDDDDDRQDEEARHDDDHDRRDDARHRRDDDGDDEDDDADERHEGRGEREGHDEDDHGPPRERGRDDDDREEDDDDGHERGDRRRDRDDDRHERGEGHDRDDDDEDHGRDRQHEDDDEDEDGGRLFYVRVSGSDSNSGTSPRRAFRTLRRAAMAARAGGTIYVGAGVYRGSCIINARTRRIVPGHWFAELARDHRLRGQELARFIHDRRRRDRATIKLIADVQGDRTGDRGPVIISGRSPMTVNNASDVVVRGFVFRNVSGAAISWKGRSRGLIQQCQFADTDIGADIQAGQVVFDRCRWVGSDRYALRALAGVDVVLNDCSVTTSHHAALLIDDQARIDARQCRINGNYGLGIAARDLESGDSQETGRLQLTDCELNNNAEGARLDVPIQLTASNTRFTGNHGWGIVTSGPSSLTACRIDHNGVGGLWLKQLSDDQLQIAQCTATGNDHYGLFAERSTLAFNGEELDELQVQDSHFLLVGYQSHLSFDGVTLSGGDTAALLSFGGSLQVDNSTLTNHRYGIVTSQTDTTVERSLLSGNSVALYASRNGSLVVRQCEFSDNRNWAATVYSHETDQHAITFDGCRIHDNTNGLYVTRVSDTTFELIGDTEIYDNQGSGVHLEQCQLALYNPDGLPSGGWRSYRNGYGISVSDSTVTLDGAVLEQARLAGVYSTRSNLRLHKSLITGRQGVIAEANYGLTADASRLVGIGSSNTDWALRRTGGECTVRNCLISGFANGMYFSARDGSDQAKVLNTTIVNVQGQGITVASGRVQLTNSIIMGSNGQTALVRQGGTLQHSHNLFYGFNETYHGTNPDPTESVKNPRFVDPAGGNYHLAVGSPAINAGTDVGIELRTDLDGNLRPQFQAYEIGAYEYTDPNGSLRIIRWEEQQ